MKYLILFVSLVLAVPCSADEQIVDFEEDSLPVLNDELRAMRNDISNNDIWDDSDDVSLSEASDVDFQQKQGKQFVIENRTSDPSSPSTGQIWIRTDL